MIAAQRTNFVYRPSQPWVPTNMDLAFIFENGDDLEDDVKMVQDELVVSSDDERYANGQVLQNHYGKDGGQSKQSTNTMTEPIQSGSPQTTIGHDVRQRNGSSEVHD